MIVVVYKKKGDRGCAQLPFKSISEAIKTADNLHKKGYLGVKVLKVKEEIIYIPQS